MGIKDMGGERWSWGGADTGASIQLPTHLLDNGKGGRYGQEALRLPWPLPTSLPTGKLSSGGGRGLF